jgi:hypothetical protein
MVHYPRARPVEDHVGGAVADRDTGRHAVGGRIDADHLAGAVVHDPHRTGADPDVVWTGGRPPRVTVSVALVVRPTTTFAGTASRAAIQRSAAVGRAAAPCTPAASAHAAATAIERERIAT